MGHFMPPRWSSPCARTIPFGASVSFIAVAAALSAMTLQLGIIAGQLLGTGRGNAAPMRCSGSAARLGAAAYGALIHLSGIYELTARSLAVLCVNCLLAACAAFFTLARFHSLGRWWLAVLWWYAFSGGLWYFDKPATSPTAGARRFRDNQVNAHAPGARPDPGSAPASAAAMRWRPASSRARALSRCATRPETVGFSTRL